MPVVTIIYRFLPQYRVDFFNRLKQSLQDEGIALELIYGKNRQESLKQDERDIPWATPVHNREFSLGGRQFYYQQLPGSLCRPDLMILMQETRIISNFAVLGRAKLSNRKIAFWGHGINFQDNPQSLANRLKRAYSTRVDWWFAYTEHVAQLIENIGFPRERITVVQNAIDTNALAAEFARIPESDITELRRQLGIGSGPVGLFCGSMYKEKRLAFLLESCAKLRATVPGFELVLIGTGPDASLVRQFAASHAWAHYVGPKFDLDRVPYFKLADTVLMPGAAGLGVLDSFAFQRPMVVPEYPFHGPEIEYVHNRVNGIICPDSIEEFVSAAKVLLTSPALRECLKEGCRAAAARYTLEAMVANFREGVRRALALPLTTRPTLPAASA